jgi:hypothetical protein
MLLTPHTLTLLVLAFGGGNTTQEGTPATSTTLVENAIPTSDDPTVVRRALFQAIGLVVGTFLFLVVLQALYLHFKSLVLCPAPQLAPNKNGVGSSDGYRWEVKDVDLETGTIPTTTPATAPLQAARSVGFFQLYRFATGVDKALLAAGVLCSGAVGLVWPAFYVLMGSILDAFVYSSDPVAAVSTYCMYLAAIGGGGLLVGFGSLACWMQLSERQTNQMRTRYLQSLLNQDQVRYSCIILGGGGRGTQLPHAGSSPMLRWLGISQCCWG